MATNDPRVIAPGFVEVTENPVCIHVTDVRIVMSSLKSQQEAVATSVSLARWRG
jgi:hypothetical protein